MQVVEDYAQSIRSADLEPDEFVVLAKDGNRLKVECRQSGAVHEVLNFCNNDILGLAQDRAVKDAAIRAIEDFGTSNSGCMALCGRSSPHVELEREIAAFKGLAHTHLFVNAWMALQAFVDGFCHLALPVPGYRNDRRTLILTDILNHACITSAVSRAGTRSGKLLADGPAVRVASYRNRDVNHMRRKLRDLAQPGDRILVLTDSVFSMDGTIVPLPEMVEVLAAYPGATLVLDEAHASGAIGAHGGGVCDHFGMTPDMILARGVHPVILTTFSKFAGSAGAAISCHSKAMERLLNACPTSIGTVSLPPPAAAATAEAIRQLRARPELVSRLRRNTALARERLAQAGFDVLGSTNVLPIPVPPEASPRQLARDLIERHGVWVSPVWYIARPRLRAVVNALHTDAEISRLTHALSEVSRQRLLKPHAV